MFTLVLHDAMFNFVSGFSQIANSVSFACLSSFLRCMLFSQLFSRIHTHKHTHIIFKKGEIYTTEWASSPEGKSGTTDQKKKNHIWLLSHQMTSSALLCLSSSLLMLVKVDCKADFLAFSLSPCRWPTMSAISQIERECCLLCACVASHVFLWWVRSIIAVSSYHNRFQCTCFRASCCILCSAHWIDASKSVFCFFFMTSLNCKEDGLVEEPLAQVSPSSPLLPAYLHFCFCLLVCVYVAAKVPFLVYYLKVVFSSN